MTDAQRAKQRLTTANTRLGLLTPAEATRAKKALDAYLDPKPPVKHADVRRRLRYYEELLARGDPAGR